MYQHIIYNVYVMSAHHHQHQHHQHHAPVCLTRLRACSGFWLRKIDTLRACAICVCVCVHQTTSDVAGEIQKWFSVNKYAESVQMINSTQLRPEPLRRHKFDFPNPCVTLYCIYARTHTHATSNDRTTFPIWRPPQRSKPPLFMVSSFSSGMQNISDVLCVFGLVHHTQGSSITLTAGMPRELRCSLKCVPVASSMPLTYLCA